MGLRVPEDLAVVGFDGTKAAEFCWPPLTVIAQPVRGMAQAAVRLAISRGGDMSHRLFTGSLTLRQSCGCRPSTGEI